MGIYFRRTESVKAGPAEPAENAEEEHGATRKNQYLRNATLDPYKGIIDERLEEFPRLSAKRLFDKVRAAGYTGG